MVTGGKDGYSFLDVALVGFPCSSEWSYIHTHKATLTAPEELSREEIRY